MLARLQKSMKAKDQGFTLIELLVVIVIIGILAAIAIPLFLSQRQKGVEAGIKSDLKSAATALETKSIDDATWTAGAGDTVKSVESTFRSTENNSIIFLRAVTSSAAYCLKGTSTGPSGTFYYGSSGGVVTTTAC